MARQLGAPGHDLEALTNHNAVYYIVKSGNRPSHKYSLDSLFESAVKFLFIQSHQHQLPSC